jgi:hypothetical protein
MSAFEHSSHSTRSTNDSAHRGQHICLPFESDGEKESVLLSFMHEGLTRGQRCLFVGARHEYEQLGVHLEEEGICSLRAESRGALFFKTPEEVYLQDGSFDPEAVLGTMEKYLKDALSDGFTGLCVTGELSNVPSDEDWRRIVWYEAQVNERFARLPVAGLCRYPRAIVPPHRVQDVLRTHPVAVVRGENCDNPFYERAELAVSDDSQARVDWQLRQLRVQNRAKRHLQDKTTSAVGAAVELATELATLRSTIRDTRSS